MSELPDPVAAATVKAERELARLDAQVAAMRVVLVRLLQEVVQAEQQLDHSQATQLLQANEQLVINARGARSEAESAVGALDEASWSSEHDPLTGLPNRALLSDRLHQAISHAKRHDHRVALLFLDLDGFKQINDTFGHATGDEALQLVADSLTSLVRETDTVGRHGGDEFMIVLAEVSQAVDASIIAEKVNAALRACSQIDGRVVNLAASIGISIYPEDGDDAKTLIDRADAAMYRAKKYRLGGFAFHSDQPMTQSGRSAQSLKTRRRHLTDHDLTLVQHELTLVEHERRHALLQEANEQLVLAALGVRV